MKTFSVTVALIITGNSRKVFSVLAKDIIRAQVRVLSRIKGVLNTTMFEVVSAAEQCLHLTDGTLPPNLDLSQPETNPVSEGFTKPTIGK